MCRVSSVCVGAELKVVPRLGLEGHVLVHLVRDLSGRDFLAGQQDAGLQRLVNWCS